MTTAPINSEPVAVDIRAIERELTELWRGAGADGKDAVSRVCALNLLAVTAPGPDAGHVAGLATELAGRFPTRTIVAECDPAGADELAAWVQANCSLPAAGRPQVCCEQITIKAGGAAVARVPGTVLPLLVSDVPTMLLWPLGEPFDHPLYRRMAALASRLIVDSRSFAEPLSGLRRLGGLLGGEPRISDLSWGRLTPWRELTAQFFDAPAMTPHLSALRRVTVRCAARGTAYDQIEPLLFVGWLASRLGLTLAGTADDPAGHTTVLLRRAGGPGLTATIVPEEAAEAQTAITLVELVCDSARFEVRLADSPGYALARAEVQGMAALQRLVPLDVSNDAGLIAAELQLLGRDKGYEAALREVMGM